MIALNPVYDKKEKIYPAYISKHNLKCKKEVIILMIPNGERWNYLAVINFCIIKRTIVKT